MSQTFSAIYEDGVLRPLTPLGLPDHEVIRLSIVPNDEVEPSQPGEPGRMSSAEFRRRIAELATPDRGLPDDFTRADIYLDHD